jgi:hypothetical protein
MISKQLDLSQATNYLLQAAEAGHYKKEKGQTFCFWATGPPTSHQSTEKSSPYIFIEFNLILNFHISLLWIKNFSTLKILQFSRLIIIL